MFTAELLERVVCSFESALSEILNCFMEIALVKLGNAYYIFS